MAVTDQDVAAIHHMLVYSMAQGAARAPVDPDESMRFIYETVTSKDGAAALMVFADGRLIGSMGIMQTQYWYSRDSFLRETWLYVLPEFENAGGMKALLQEAMAISDVSGMALVIAPTAKGRRRGAQREHIATLYGYEPMGNVYAFNPKGS